MKSNANLVYEVRENYLLTIRMSSKTWKIKSPGSENEPRTL